ncbi:hypothetical protein C8Q74DRAFT_98322 [Fomes fomentarius]|nr:hypothetical protein C8Q74DRAFT_98322 [Fomes fomentarius]
MPTMLSLFASAVWIVLPQMWTALVTARVVEMCAIVETPDIRRLCHAVVPLAVLLRGDCAGRRSSSSLLPNVIEND